MTEIIEVNLMGLKRRFDKNTLNDYSYLKINDKNSIISVDEEDNTLLETLKKELEKLNDFDVYIDVGAGNGDTTLLLQKGFCFTFEPSERNFTHLIRNVALNPELKIIPIQRALSNCEYYYKINQQSLFSTLDSISIAPKFHRKVTTTLDNFFFEFGLPIKLIKIDAEGCDYFILEGAQQIINKFKPIIVVEKNCHTNPEYSQHIVDFFIKNNYSIEEINRTDILGRYKNE